MKKNLLSLIVLAAISFSSKAQFSASNLSLGLSGSYTSYKGDVDKSTPGVQLTAGYNFGEKYGVSLGFNYGFPMKESYNDEGIKSELKTSFNTLSLAANYHLIGTTESNFSFYIPVGASLVMGKTKVSADGSSSEDGIDFSFENLSMSESFSDFVINGGLGAQFKLGRPLLFIQGGVAIPAGSSSTNSRTGDSEGSDNPIPFHSSVQIGLKIPLGSSY